ncbi:MAG: hypothetical protein R2838_07115 [Caldilineaceae bacterium]
MWLVRPLAKLVNGNDSAYPLQIDRVALDQALYEKAVLSPYCNDVQASLTALDYDRATDRVRRMTLDDGSEIAVSQLFDASGTGSIVAAQIGLVRTTIDDNALVQAYLSGRAARPAARQPWQDALTIIRLYRDTDGIDALATLIPLGDRLSLRVSTALSPLQPAASAHQPGMPADALLALAKASIAKVWPMRAYPVRCLWPPAPAPPVVERALAPTGCRPSTAYANRCVDSHQSTGHGLRKRSMSAPGCREPGAGGALYQHFMDYYRSMPRCWRMLATRPSGDHPVRHKAMLAQYIHAKCGPVHAGAAATAPAEPARLRLAGVPSRPWTAAITCPTWHHSTQFANTMPSTHNGPLHTYATAGHWHRPPGLLISIALSRAQIAHVLIGDAPGDRLPRPGQILTPTSTTIFAKHFPTLAGLAHPKRSRLVCFGDYRAARWTENPWMFTVRPFLGNGRGSAPFRYPWNLDRVAADAALLPWRRPISPAPRLPAQSVTVEFDAATDRVNAVQLADGSRLRTSHVFDASGHARTLARQLRLAPRPLGVPQLVVQGLYAVENEACLRALADVPWYRDTATVIRVFRASHGFDGMAVCVPLGDRVMIQAQRPSEEAGPSPAAMLAGVVPAMQEYGVDFSRCFVKQVGMGADVQEQYVHGRGHGANWVLTGSAYINTLVTSASSTDTSMAAYDVAVPFVANPPDAGRRYQGYLDYFLTMHEVWQWGITRGEHSLSVNEVEKQIAKYTWANQAQFYQLAELKHYADPKRFGMQLTRQVLSNRALMLAPAPFKSVSKIRRQTVPGDVTSTGA